MSEQDQEPMSLDELAAEGDEMEAMGEEGVLERIANIEAERDAFEDKWKRALADAENVRRRADRDRREAENYGGSKLARDLLPVYDNLRRALKSTEEAEGAANAALLEGVELTMRELLNVFKKHGIEPIVPEVGDKFDPKLHQAMFEAPVPGTTKDHILEFMAEGFLLHDRLLRPAQVGVSSMPASYAFGRMTDPAPVTIPPSRFDLGHLFGGGLVALGCMFLAIAWPDLSDLAAYRDMTGDAFPLMAVVAVLLILAGGAAVILAPFAQAHVTADASGLTIGTRKGLPMVPQQTIPWDALSEITVNRQLPRVTTIAFHRRDKGKVWVMNAAGLSGRPADIIDAVTPFLAARDITLRSDCGALTDRYLFG